MDRAASLDRRRVIRSVPAAVLAGIAGCGAPADDEEQVIGNDTQTSEAIETEQTERTDHDEGSGTEAGQEGDNDEGSATGADHEEGTGHENGHGEELHGPEAEADVAMVTADGEHHFEPHVVWVENGGTVTWTRDGGSHSATAYHSGNDRPSRVPDGTGAWDSEVISDAGATFERRFDADGVYDYFCRPHEDLGMVGTVVVGEPDPDGQPELAPPSSDLPENARTSIESLNERVTAALEDH